MTPSPIDLLHCAERTARAAGTHALRHYSRRREVDKAFRYDLKLVLDRECQGVAEGEVLREYPDHAILGEEGERGGLSNFTWIIDPIDGTLNFTHGLPHWGVSVAVADASGTVLAGCVYMPMYEECCCASTETPSLCNGRVMRVSDTPSAATAMVLAGLRNPEVPTESDPVFLALVPRCQKVRCFGAAAPDLCWVAAGKADAYVDQGLWAWDFAAGNLIVQQAGGRVKVQPLSFEKRRHRLLAAPPALFSELDPLVFAE